jgi:DNA-binding CsgD family transcriptional regulator
MATTNKVQLTKRQVYILNLMCKDYNHNNIAIKLNCSLSLVEKEVYFLKQIFKVETHTALIYKYFKNKNYSNATPTIRPNIHTNEN